MVGPTTASCWKCKSQAATANNHEKHTRIPPVAVSSITLAVAVPVPLSVLEVTVASAVPDSVSVTIRLALPLSFSLFVLQLILDLHVDVHNVSREGSADGEHSSEQVDSEELTTYFLASELMSEFRTDFGGAPGIPGLASEQEPSWPTQAERPPRAKNESENLLYTYMVRYMHDNTEKRSRHNCHLLYIRNHKKHNSVIQYRFYFYLPFLESQYFIHSSLCRNGREHIISIHLCSSCPSRGITGCSSRPGYAR